MADSTQILPPGFRVTDNATGAPIDGAILYVYDAGTSTPKTVYADKDLLTALGTSVTCDSMGVPTSDGSTATLIYTGTAAYKITIKDSDGNTIKSFDNVRGALDTSGFGGSGSVTASFPVVTKSLDYTVLSADQNTLFVVNCSSADVTLTLPSAVTVGDGWSIKMQHAGSGNQAILATVSSQTISEGTKSYGTQYPLARNGEELTLISDGGNWRITDHTLPFLKFGQGVIPIVDRVSAAPSSPDAGTYYLVSSAYSTFSTGDIIFYTGASWVAFTPYTDCGWIVWVADEDIYYFYRSTAWVTEYASTTKAGTCLHATQADQEALTAGRAVTSDVQQYHPSAAKAWVTFNGTGTPAISRANNVSSITDNGTGDYTINFTTAFSDTNFAWSANANFTVNGTNGTFISDVARTTSSLRISVVNVGVAADLSRVSVIVFGDQ